MQLRLVILFLFIFSISSAQEITVLDKVTAEPLVNVAIYNKEKSISAVTDIFGKADISEFTETEVIIFKSMSYIEAYRRKREILNNDKLVLLESLENKLDQVTLSVARFKLKKNEIPQKNRKYFSFRYSTGQPSDFCRFTGEYRAGICSKEPDGWG